MGRQHRVEFGIENGAKVDTIFPQADNSKKRAEPAG
jgi:hypothetical protein